VVYADCGKGLLQGETAGGDGHGAGVDEVDEEGKEERGTGISKRDGAGVEEGLEEGGGAGGGRQGRVRLDMLPDRLHPGAKGMHHLLPCVKAAVDRAKGGGDT
jgi:hypothetical protein